VISGLKKVLITEKKKKNLIEIDNPFDIKSEEKKVDVNRVH